MIKFDFNNMMDAYIGSEGINEKDIEAVMPKIEDAYSYFEKNRGTGWDGASSPTIRRVLCAISSSRRRRCAPNSKTS